MSSSFAFIITKPSNLVCAILICPLHCSKMNFPKTLVPYSRASQVALVVKNLPTKCRRHKRCGFDPWVGKIPLEEGMVTHPSILAWRIPWTEESGRLQSTGLQRVGQTEAALCVCARTRAHTHTHTHTMALRLRARALELCCLGANLSSAYQ